LGSKRKEEHKKTRRREGRENPISKKIVVDSIRIVAVGDANEEGKGQKKGVGGGE